MFIFQFIQLKIEFIILGIVLIGEIGGQAEEKASEYLRNNNCV